MSSSSRKEVESNAGKGYYCIYLGIIITWIQKSTKKSGQK